MIKPYAYLNNIQVDRIVENVSEYMKKSESYLSTLILVKAIKMVADGMPLAFSNRTWTDILKENTSIRGLQHAFKKLEHTVLPGFDKPIFQRTFKDDKKRHRTAFKVDTQQLIYLLSLTESDVKDMPRGTLEKHFFYQSGLVVRHYLKDLKKAEKLATRKDFQTNPKLQEKYNQIMANIRERQAKFDKHIERIYRRTEKAINKALVVTDDLKAKALKEFASFLKDNNYTPPKWSNN